MKFTYTYRSSDGQRHVGEIEAESRDAAFGKIRAEMGVKPIKVTVAGGETASVQQQEVGRSPRDRRHGRAALVAAVVLAALAGGAWWWTARRGAGDAAAPHGADYAPQPESAPYQVMTPQGPVTYRIADPLPRQTIPGNRQRIEEGRNTIFTNAAERLLARFAEPGRAVDMPTGGKPSEAEFAACLREPIHVVSTDFTEVSDLKRIVAGLKREMRAYLAGGGTVEQYLAELAKRQRLEISYRENAEQKLTAMLESARQGAGKTASVQQQGAEGTASVQQQGAGGTASVQQQGAEAALRKAYDYWLKANASLKSMGIYELPLSDALQTYQAGLGLDE